MAVQFKDYYQVLGVSRSANEADLRKAFRKLAREHHPDVAKNKAQAEEKFKAINEAYEVLSDPEKRKKYDALGANWKQGAEFRPPPGWGSFPGGAYTRATGRGGGGTFEFAGTGFSDFFEQLFGAQGRRGQSRQHDASAADTLETSGQDLEADLLVTLEEALHGSRRAITVRREVACDKCGGTGIVRQRPCPHCAGSGQTSRTEQYQVKIPAGVTEGQQLRVSGKGQVGVHGGRPGDLYLRVRLAKHPDFRVAGSDVFADVALAPWEAVLGAQIPVTTLDGSVEIKIPPGTQSGHQLRVRSRGLGKEGARGNLYVAIRIQVPDKVTDGERRVWEQLAQASHFQPRD